MMEIVKSDLYYQWKNKKVMICAWIVCILYIFEATMGNLQWELEISLFELTCLMIRQQYMVIVLLLLGVSCYYVGRLFTNKFVNLQVVAADRNKTLWSKYFVQAFINIILTTLLFFIALLGLVLVYKVNSISPGGVFILYIGIIVLMIRYTVQLVSVVFWVRNGVLAAILNWMLFVAELFPLLIGTELGIPGLVEISNLFVSGQLLLLVSGEQWGMIFIRIILTMAVEMGIYILVTIYKFQKTELL